MKNLITAILAAMAFTALAAVPGLDAAVAQPSLHQLLRERNLTLGDNRLTSRAPRQAAGDNLNGPRIMLVETRYIDDFDYNGQPVLNDTAYSKSWQVATAYDPDGQILTLEGFYGEYSLPVSLDMQAGTATINSRICLSTDNYSELNVDGFDYYFYLTDYFYTRDFFFDNIDEPLIGTIYDDGSIMFDGQCVIYTEVVTKKFRRNTTNLISADTTATISPMISNIFALVPNGVHAYDRCSTSGSAAILPYGTGFNSFDTGSWSLVNGTFIWMGGLAGTLGVGKRPIDPRKPTRGSSFNSTYHHRLKIDTLAISGRVPLHFVADWNTLEPTGVGKRPIDPRKPYTPGLDPDHDNTAIRSSRLHTTSTDSVVAPVYMYQPDDSTLVVYNLFGNSNSMLCMTIGTDSVVNFPCQEVIYNASSQADYSNYTLSGDSLVAGNVAQATDSLISWGQCILYGSHSYYDYYYTNNRLYFTDGDKFILGVMRGDVDRNRTVNISDVVSLISRISNQQLEPCDNFNPMAADVNGDNAINITDVILLIAGLSGN